MPNTNSLDLEATSSQYASRADTASLSITGNMTIECWLKLESAPGAGAVMHIVNKWINSGQLSYAYQYRDTAGTKNFAFHTSSNGTNSATSSVNYTLTTGTWTHVALVYTAATGGIELFINGVSQGTGTGAQTSIFDGTDAFEVGAGNAGSFYDGLIDDVRVWAAARTGTQISDNYQIELVGNETNLNAYWKLNNGYTDETANANTLTASGSPVFSTDVPFTGGVAYIGKYW